MTAGAGLRVLRAAVFTAVCVVLSAAGHVLAADKILPLWTLAAAFGVMFLLVALPLAGRERSLPGIAATLATGQLALHTLFAYGQHTAAARHTAGAERHGVVGLAGRLQSAVHAALAMLSGPMLLGHLVAALAAGWLLRRGEAALWRLVRLSAGAVGAAGEWVTARALRAALRCVPALLDGLLPEADMPHTGPDSGGPQEPVCVHLRHAVHRRGPPATTESRGRVANVASFRPPGRCGSVSGASPRADALGRSHSCKAEGRKRRGLRRAPATRGWALPKPARAEGALPAEGRGKMRVHGADPQTGLSRHAPALAA